MESFDGFFGILSLNALKWPCNEDEDEKQVEKKEHHNLMINGQREKGLAAKEFNP